VQQKLYPYLQLMRPANIITAFADILAGYAIVAAPITFDLFYLLITTMCLYAGGIIFNDVFDVAVDRIERPHRPLASQAIKLQSGILIGSALFIVGLLSASLVNQYSFIVAFSIVVACLVYDGYLKKEVYLGSINMGICRALNLCLGMSCIPSAMHQTWWVSLFPLVFITGVNLLSREEANPQSWLNIRISMILYGLTLIGIIFLLSFGYFAALSTLPVILLLLITNYYPLIKIKRAFTAEHVQEAVKAGILSLILLDAIYSIGLGNWQFGFFIILLLPIANMLSKFFYVT